MEPANICIVKPNKKAFSETFIQEHINRLQGNKKVLYGGSFPLFDDQDNYLIRSKLGLLSYLFQKRILKKKNIPIRIKALRDYLKREKIDVVLAEYGMTGAMVAPACKMANVPLVIHFHGADVHHKQTVKDFLPFYKSAFSYACKLVAVSNVMVEELKRLGAPADKIVLNAYGVDTTRFVKAVVSQSQINFLAVGRFVEKKSPSSVVKAFDIVASKFPQAHLTMVGVGPLLEETQQLADKLGLTSKLTFTGVLTSAEIQLLMQQMRCFVQHSVTAADGDMEGTPNTILEAGASGLPIVSTAHAGIKEAVIDGVTGYLVQEHDIEGMAQKMILLAESPEKAAQLGAAGREHILKNYNMPDRINTLNDIVHKCIR
ncbi:MAG: glycosyltransferase [Mucilaginibacter sp.]|nr:glycosyltransferase [Mucilaginibacter sp.]